MENRTHLILLLHFFTPLLRSLPFLPQGLFLRQRLGHAAVFAPHVRRAKKTLAIDEQEVERARRVKQTKEGELASKALSNK